MKPLLYVYVVDDNHSVLSVMKKLIRAEFNVNVRTFDNAEDCLRMIDKRIPDFVICDYDLNPLEEENKMNGEDLLKIIKEDYPAVRVIMYSSKTELNTIVDLLKSGAVDFVGIGKEFRGRLTTTIRSTLRQVKTDKEKNQTRRGIIILIALVFFANTIFYFIERNFLVYILLSFILPVAVILSLGYYKYFDWFNKGMTLLGRLFSMRRRKEFKIFVVDDSEVYRLMIKQALKSEQMILLPYKFSIKTFATALSCINALDEMPDVVILDYLLEDTEDKLKRIDGLKMLSEIKKKSPYTKVIMISTQKDVSVISKLLKEGANDYIVKDKLWLTKMKDATLRMLRSKAKEVWS